MCLIFFHFLTSLKSLPCSTDRRLHLCLRPFRHTTTTTAHDMPTIAKLPGDSWRVQLRRKGRHISKTFVHRDEALRWSRLAQLAVDRNETPISSSIARLTKFGELVQLHIEDMTAVGKPSGWSKAAT
jgi:hypothetical protein